MMKNKIGWCDMTWNPVWGCNNHCEYCYARKIAKRFGSVMAENEYYSHYWSNKRCAKDINKAEVKRVSKNLREFNPTFLYGQYFKHFPKKPQRIFVGSMSEIYYWKKEWVEKVLNKIREYPQHTFIFLTKHPRVYVRWNFPSNCWLGVTITKNIINTRNREPDRWNAYQFKMEKANNLKFYCFEPLLEAFDLAYFPHLAGIEWVIIGAETGNRKGKVIPKREWIEDIVDHCKDKNIPVYLKDSLKNIYSAEIKEFPTVEE